MSSRTPRTLQLAGHFTETTALDLLPGVETGTAYECAVDVGLGHDPRDVVRLDRATAKNTRRGGHLGAVQLRESYPQARADLLSVVRSHHLPGSHGPARLAP